jgi:hypothetical protein
MRLFLFLLSLALAVTGAVPALAQEEAPAEASSCLRCHGGMGGRLGDPVGQWRGSVHARNGIGCHSCHGGNPALDSMEAMSPAHGFAGVPAEEKIPAFCGKCHAGVEEDYLASAHGQALGAGGPHCATCHGNHAVQVATIDLINRESCTRCHGYERAEEIREALAQTDQMISGLDQDIFRLHRVGLETEPLRGDLFAVRNDFHRLVHSVDVPKIRQQTAGFQVRLAEIRSHVEGLQNTLAGRYRIGAVVVALLALATLLSYLLRRTYQKEEEREGTAAGRRQRS